jgi:uncharacterized membrane protein YbhN (UPF0104 family)
VIWWIFRQDAPKLPESGTGFAWMGLSLVLSAATYALRGLRWHKIMRLADVDHRAADAYGLTVVGYMGNNVLPARGGEVLKIALLGARSRSRKREILGSVIAERLLDASTLVALFVGLTLTGVAVEATGRRPALILGGLLVAAGLGLGLYRALRRRGRLESFSARIRPVSRASKLFARPQGAVLAALSAVIWFAEGLYLIVIARAIGIDLSLIDGTALIVLASLLAAVPAAPGYAGTFDAGLILGLHAVDVTGGSATGMLLLTRFMLFAPVTIAGLVALLGFYGGIERFEARTSLERQEPAQAGRQQVGP